MVDQIEFAIALLLRLTLRRYHMFCRRKSGASEFTQDYSTNLYIYAKEKYGGRSSSKFAAVL